MSLILFLILPFKVLERSLYQHYSMIPFFILQDFLFFIEMYNQVKIVKENFRSSMSLLVFASETFMAFPFWIVYYSTRRPLYFLLLSFRILKLKILFDLVQKVLQKLNLQLKWETMRLLKLCTLFLELI